MVNKRAVTDNLLEKVLYISPSPPPQKKKDVKVTYMCQDGFKLIVDRRSITIMQLY